MKQRIIATEQTPSRLVVRAWSGLYAVLISAVALGLSACGQKGPLRLPDAAKPVAPAGTNGAPSGAVEAAVRPALPASGVGQRASTITP